MTKQVLTNSLLTMALVLTAGLAAGTASALSLSAPPPPPTHKSCKVKTAGGNTLATCYYKDGSASANCYDTSGSDWAENICDSAGGTWTRDRNGKYYCRSMANPC